MKSAFCQIPHLRNQIVKSHTVRYKDCDPAQIVLSTESQASSFTFDTAFHIIVNNSILLFRVKKLGFTVT